MAGKQFDDIVGSIKRSPDYMRGHWEKVGPNVHKWRGELRKHTTRRQRYTFLTLILIISGVFAFDFWLWSCAFRGCPSVADIRAYQPTEGGRVLDRTGTVLGQMTSIKRENVPLDLVPEHVRHAFIATEDRRFYDHPGIDWRAMLRAISRNVRSLSFAEGFSTITMQLARTSFIEGGRGGNPIGRKFLEMRLSRIIENALTKDEILAHYLNAIYLGGGVYGVEGASKDLFGKSVRNVSIGEAAVLAALPKAPTVYNPRANMARAKTRRNLVLGLMVQEGMLNSEVAERERLAPVKVAATTWANGRNEPSALTPVRLFVDSILETLRRSGEEVYAFTTLDARAQKAADNAVTRRAAAIEKESKAWYGRRKPEGEVQGAMVAIDPQTGAILALVGAGKYERGGFNRALYAKRQPGSAFKPFVYAAALSRGFTAASMLEDEPISVDDAGAGKVWTPSNYGGEYSGTITMRTALAKSANAATVRVSRQIGESNVMRFAQMNGIESHLLPVPALALGAMEVTPVELVTAYAPFSNGGYRVHPTLVTRIESRSGELLWNAPEPQRSKVMDERDAFLITSMLRSVVDEGTGSAIRSYGVTGVVAGKTGTTNDAADVWFVGYTPTIIAGFWFGYDQPKQISSNATGGRLVAPAWAEFYRNGWRDRDVWKGWDVPSGMVQRTIDVETGMLAGDWCPLVREEWFKSGTEPQEFCDHHASGWDIGAWIGRAGQDVARAVGRILSGRRADTLKTRPDTNRAPR